MIEEKNENIINKRYIKYGIYFILIIITVILGEFFLSIKGDEDDITKLDYFDKPSIDYRVYYNENPYFNQKYLEKGNTYVSSYVDHIDIDFSYYLSYSDRLKAQSEYYIEANIIASDASTGEVIWDNYKKELLSPKTIEVNHGKDYNINETVSIDYKEFNDFLNEFKNNNQMALKAYLSVSLYVANTATHEDFKDISSSNILKVEIPLDEAHFKITENVISQKDTFKTTKRTNNKLKFTLIMGILLWLIVIFLAILFALTYHNDTKRQSAYRRKLRKILSTYDSIIVNVEKFPFTGDLNVVFVTSFEELVDAQNEVRLPINFKENKQKNMARFVLIRNNLAWVYVLTEDNAHK